MTKKRFALGVAFAALAGAAAGVLAAPKSGKETRADIKKKADKVKAGANKKAKEVKKTVKKVGKDVGSGAKDLKKRSKNAVKSAKAGFKEDPKK